MRVPFEEPALKAGAPPGQLLGQADRFKIRDACFPGVGLDFAVVADDCQLCALLLAEPAQQDEIDTPVQYFISRWQHQQNPSSPASGNLIAGGRGIVEGVEVEDSCFHSMDSLNELYCEIATSLIK